MHFVRESNITDLERRFNHIYKVLHCLITPRCNWRLKRFKQFITITQRADPFLPSYPPTLTVSPTSSWKPLFQDKIKFICTVFWVFLSSCGSKASIPIPSLATSVFPSSWNICTTLISWNILFKFYHCACTFCFLFQYL